MACTGEGHPPRPATRRGQPLAAPLTGPPRGAGWREGCARGRSPACSRQALRDGLRASACAAARGSAPAREEPTAHPALSLQLESLAHHQEGDTRDRRSPPVPSGPRKGTRAVPRRTRSRGMGTGDVFKACVPFPCPNSCRGPQDTGRGLWMQTPPSPKSPASMRAAGRGAGRRRQEDPAETRGQPWARPAAGVLQEGPVLAPSEDRGAAKVVTARSPLPRSQPASSK